jgi:hypothetical protein
MQYTANQPDLTKFDILKAYIKYGSMTARTYFDMVRLLRKKYDNYLSVAYRLKRKQFPINAKLKDGTEKGFNRQEEVWVDIRNLSYNVDSDILMIDDIKLKGGANFGDINNIFINKDYSFLPLKGRIIIDIGANIADSSIYFIQKGAEKVYAVEPNRVLYDLAVTNIGLNSMSNHIETVFAGCSSKTSRDSDPPFLTLEELVRSCVITPDFLKLDCEGCEYDIIMNTPDKILAAFSYIFVEYHYGYRNIKRRLEGCGFKVEASEPTYYPQNNLDTNLNTRFSTSNSRIETVSLIKPFVGLLYASKTL